MRAELLTWLLKCDRFVLYTGFTCKPELMAAILQGYLRAAKLLFDLKKYDAADQLVQLGLAALPPAKRTALEALRERICATKYSSRPSPFTRLPVEIVLQIFNDIVEHDEFFPIVLSHVSSQWRAFVLSKPFYWRSLVLSNKDPVNKTEKWIKRSQHCIRRLVLRRNISSKQLNICLNKLGTTLFKTLRNFHSEIGLGLVFGQLLPSDKSDIIRVFESLLSLSLEDIQLSSDKHNYPTLPRDSDSKFTQIIIPSLEEPCLRTLIVEYTDLNWSTIFPRVTSLRQLELRWTNFDVDIMDVLKGNPQLVSLTLEGDFNLTETPNIPASRYTAEMVNLVQLEVRGPMEPLRFISLASFPALRQLEFCGTLSKLDNIFTYFQPIPTDLTHLHIRNCLFNTEPILALILKLSKLEVLTITHYVGDINSIVDLLAGPPEMRHPVHPHLSQVDFSHSPFLTGGPLVRLVKSRHTEEKDIAKIKTMVIDGCPMIDPSVPEWLKPRVERVSCIYMSKKEKYRREWA